MKKVHEWLEELGSHDIYDAVWAGQDFEENTGHKPTWKGMSHADTKRSIEARGLGGWLKPDTGKELIAGFELAEHLADQFVPGQGRHHMLEGRGSRFRAAIAALKEKGI